MIRNKQIIFIFLFSTIYFLFTWSFSFYLYEEDLLSKIIHESTLYGDGANYFPLIKYLTSLDFNNSFDPYIDDLNNITIPYGSLFIHAIFYKIFGLYGLIIPSYIAILLFLIIFYKIFNLYFSQNFSLIASLLLFSIPISLNLLSLDNLKYFNVISNDIFSLRTHRPVFSSIIFYLFIYLILLIESSEKYRFNKIIFSLLGILSGLSLVGFYYYAVIEFLFFFLFLLYTYKSNIFLIIIRNYIAFTYFILSFLIISLPFLINNYFFVEQDFLFRNSVFELTSYKKSILLKHYLYKYFSLKFLFIIFISLGFLFFINKKKIKNYKLLVVFFILFISSLIAPISFILLSDKSALLYHFNNMMVITLFLFIFCFIFVLKDYLPKFLDNSFFYYSAIILIISINFFGIYNKKLEPYNNKETQNNRNEFNKVINIIKSSKINLSNSSILTLDDNLLIWLILNDVKYLNINKQLFSPKTDLMIEEDLIKNFRFLSLDNDNFMEFLANNKIRWRLINNNVVKFFYFKYSANSLNTYKGSKNFDKEILKMIENTPITLTQQFAIPDEEFKRLNLKFLKLNDLKNYTIPDLIILRKNAYIYQNIGKKIDNFCTLYEGNLYVVYGLLFGDNICKTNKNL